VCRNIVNAMQCGSSDLKDVGLLCVWVGGECRDVRESCNLLSDKNACEPEGAAMEKRAGRVFDCFWDEGNSTLNIQPSCIDEVI
jgi:hypothetical protein